jgi:hypothetical protein
MYLRVRSSWPAAFVGHVFGMAVELKLRDRVPWAGGGTCSSVVSSAEACCG